MTPCFALTRFAPSSGSFRVNLERARELCREYRLDLLPGISQMLQENPLESAKTSMYCKRDGPDVGIDTLAESEHRSFFHSSQKRRADF